VWNGLGLGDSRYLAYPVAGIVLLAAGILVFLLFPRLVEKLTGRDVIPTPARHDSSRVKAGARQAYRPGGHISLPLLGVACV
jgi:hypothetical protein